MWKKIKKVVSLCCATLLVVVATVSGTLAYESLSAQEWADQAEQNGQTVTVRLVQQQRIFDDTGATVGLAPFKNGKMLVPLVASAQYDGSNFDQYGMPEAEGYVDQIIRVENTGTVDAYVRVIVAVPAALDDDNDAGHNALHWNLGNRFMPDGNFSSINSYNAAFDDISWKYSETVAVNGIKCNIYIFTYEKPLTASSTTKAAAFTGFYLDKDVNVVDDHILLDGVDTEFTDDNVVIHVAAQAIQAYGFDNAEQAFSAADLPTNPWLGENN